MRPVCSLAFVAFVTVGLIPAFGCIQGRFINDIPALRPAKIDLSSRFSSHVDVKIDGTETKILIPTAEERAEALSKQTVAAYEAKLPGTATSEEMNDYAASLIFLKRPAEAIPILVALEKKIPGLYATAANLGTAYELVGDVPNALVWIRAGVARNPQSHRGTEWLHLAILVTKRTLQTDANWLATHSVLDAEAPRSAEETVRAIEYQLNERLHFVGPSDPIICDLFYQAAVRLNDPALQGRRNDYLQQSLRFGDLRKTLIDRLDVHEIEAAGLNARKIIPGLEGK